MRSPGLNDLYWPNAGNPDLKSEKGFNAQADWSFSNPSEGRTRYQFHGGAYLSRISSYILWQPAGIWWHPENAGNADLRGVYFRPGIILGKATGFHGLLEGEVRFSKQSLRSVNPKETESLRLPYSPEFQSFLSLSGGKGRMNGFVRLMHTGSRTSGLRGTGELDAFQMLDAGLEYRIPLQGHAMKFSAQANNLLNTNYRLVPAWPMPGRNFLLTLSLDL